MAKNWRSARVFNSNNLVALYHAETGGTDVWISWQAQESGRMFRPAGWHVSSPNFKTDPTAHFLHNGSKFFGKFGNHGRNAEQAAKDWASDKYDIAEWAKIPGFSRDWFPKPIALWAKEYSKTIAEAPIA